MNVEETKSEQKIAGLPLSMIQQISKEVKADCTVYIVDKQASLDNWLDIDLLKEAVIEEDEEKDSAYSVQLFREEKDPVEIELKKAKAVDFNGIIVEILSELIKQSLVTQNMKVMIVSDRSVTKRFNTSILVVDVDRVIYRIGKFNLAEKMASETVIERIIEVAQQIGREGREGKKVGTLFAIGDEEELRPYLKQLIMNPFKGYEKDLLDIVKNSSLNETIKNFAQLDGAFIVDNEGHILSAGTYLDVDTTGIKPYMGWGTKHLAATAITKVTSAIAVLVSESGGAVKVFKNGKLILKLA